MNQTELLQRTQEYIAEYLESDPLELTLESRLTTSLPDLDSLKLFEMVLYLEEKFEIEYDESVVEHLETVGDLVHYTEQQLLSRQGKAS
jgi:acyl carrier protein